MAGLLLRIGIGVLAVGAVLYGIYAEEEKKRYRNQEGIAVAAGNGGPAVAAGARKRLNRRHNQGLYPIGQTGISLTYHAKYERMPERGISESDVLTAIRTGGERPADDGLVRMDDGSTVVIFDKATKTVVTVYKSGESASCIIM